MNTDEQREREEVLHRGVDVTRGLLALVFSQCWIFFGRFASKFVPTSAF